MMFKMTLVTVIFVFVDAFLGGYGTNSDFMSIIKGYYDIRGDSTFSNFNDLDVIGDYRTSF